MGLTSTLGPLDPSGDFMPVGIAGWIERMGSKLGGT